MGTAAKADVLAARWTRCTHRRKSSESGATLPALSSAKGCLQPTTVPLDLSFDLQEKVHVPDGQACGDRILMEALFDVEPLPLQCNRPQAAVA